MLSSVEQAFVGRDEKRAPLKKPAWEANARAAMVIFVCCFRDPRGLISRECDMFCRYSFEV